MLDTIIQKDKELLIYLHSLGNEQWDSVWLFITHQTNWIPLFVFIIYLLFKNFGFKKGGILLLTLIIMVAFSDQFTNLIRGTFERLRPNNDTSINHLLRRLINPQSYSFTSGHATTSTAFTVFIILLFRSKYKYIKWLLLFPIVFAYSRIYLGVHFPIDILTGFCVGTTIGWLFYNLFLLFEKRFLTS